MKKLITATVAAACMIPAVSGMAGNDQVPPAKQKDLCILYGQNCSPEPQTIQDKIRKLHEEIDKGTAVYTPEELDRLKQKLRDAEGIWEFLQG